MGAHRTLLEKEWVVADVFLMSQRSDGDLMVDVCGYLAVPTVYGMNSSFIGEVAEGRQTLAH